MTDSPRRLRLLGRRGLQLVRHVPPEDALVAMTEPPTDELLVFVDERTNVSRETAAAVLGPFVAGGQIPPAAELPEPAPLEDPPPLSPARILKLEALTAQWVRQVQDAGPDATMLAPFRGLPPVPNVHNPAAAAGLAAELVPPAHLTGQRPEDRARDLAAATAALEAAAATPARVSSWTSRHDPASLAFAVRDRLSRPVPIQDVLLERGPILDQGTAPPLTVREASACTAMAAAAAANVLHRAAGSALAPIREELARHLYGRAQELDHVPGEDYAGTSVLAVMQAGQEAGWWDEYLWALQGTRDVAQALLQLRAPVVVGVGWTAGLEDPDSLGIIRPTGAPSFGHSLCVIGLRRQVGAHAGPFFVLQQSRGEAEGDHGVVYLHHSDLGRMLAGVGEAAVPLIRGGTA